MAKAPKISNKKKVKEKGRGSKKRKIKLEELKHIETNKSLYYRKERKLNSIAFKSSIISIIIFYLFFVLFNIYFQVNDKVFDCKGLGENDNIEFCFSCEANTLYFLEHSSYNCYANVSINRGKAEYIGLYVDYYNPKDKSRTVEIDFHDIIKSDKTSETISLEMVGEYVFYLKKYEVAMEGDLEADVINIGNSGGRGSEMFTINARSKTEVQSINLTKLILFITASALIFAIPTGFRALAYMRLKSRYG